MGKAMFQIAGAADTGEISAVLTQPDGANVDVAVDSPLELVSSGTYGLQLNVAGFCPIDLAFAVKIAAENSQMLPKGEQLPLACKLIRQQFVDQAAGDRSDWLFLLRCDFGFPREMVFVSGADYHHEGVNFELFSDTRRQDQLRSATKSLEAVADTSTLVSQFNFTTGKRRTYMLRSPTRWGIVSQQDYGVPAINEQGTDGLSITDVYDWIIAAGEAQAGRVVEFSIFSHAWQDGPILVNSSDRASGNERDPNDHDGRMKDFNGSNVDVTAFANAFANNAHCHVFGCYAAEVFKWCARAIANPRPEDADTVFRIRQADGSSLRLTWDECERALQIGLQENYSAHLATATGLPVWGGSPGAGASYARDGRRQFMEMDRPNYGRYIDTVRDAFELEQNDRGYLRYVNVVSHNEISGSSNAHGDAASGDPAAAGGAVDQGEATPASDTPQTTESLSIITPTEDRKQLVNLEPDGDHPEYGRVVRVEVQLDPPAAGTPIHWGIVLPA